MKKTNLFLSLGIFVVLGFLLFQNGNRPISEADNFKGLNQDKKNSKYKSTSKQESEAEQQTKQEIFANPSALASIQKVEAKTSENKQGKPSIGAKKLVTYTIDNGVAVIQGDMVLGEVSAFDSFDSATGQATEPQIRTWPTNEIPFFIQADLPNQDRVLEAIKMFSGTRVRFVPYTNQTDAIVFERKDGVCKSYVGYIGGLQKIFLSDKCGPTEVAHEIMHSLGFVHEQNRSDRDQFIRIFWDNIDTEEKINFEKFSDSAMSASGVASFDFESIMMYPDTMFSSNQNLTMKPIVEGQKIAPSDVLSAKDIERLNKIY